ncbi:MAG TPA: hypothetical protein VIL85_08920 [Thermomicrobiales bacterium]|jgi:hypothetical protein
MGYDTRLQPDYENYPAWFRAELEARAADFAYLTDGARQEAIRDNLSPRARDFLLALVVRGLLAQARLAADAGDGPRHG